MTAEDEWVDRAVAGDREALRRLLEIHTADVRRRIVIPARLRSVLSVEDIVQETHTDAFLKIEGFRRQDGSSFGSWLRVLALNNLRDAVRCFQTQKRDGGVNLAQPAPGACSVSLSWLYGEVSDAGSKAAREEGIVAIRQAMGALSEPHRLVVQMYDVDERPVEEVAAELGRSIGATFMLRARAMRRLEEILGTRSMYLG